MVNKKRWTIRLGTILTATALSLPLISIVSAQGSANAQPPEMTRANTLFTSGTSYIPPTNFNPLAPAQLYTGTMGLLYEPLFLYNPLTGGFIPWLASAGSWTGPSTYTITVRSGVDWSNGSPLTGADVAFSIGLAQTNPQVPYANLGQYLSSVTASGNTVTVNFTSPTPYEAWQNYLWNDPVLPEPVFGPLGNTGPNGQTTDPNLPSDPSDIVSSGPMTLVSTSPTEACYQDNPNWWGIADLGLSFQFEYLCDVVNGPYDSSLINLLQDNVDWSNNFIPGINMAMTSGGDYYLSTYYPSAPYMMAANTVWLEMNTNKAPFNNLDFRKAVAYGIDPQQIVQDAYDGICSVAGPTGLLPNLSSWVNPAVVSQYGFSYNVAKAKAFLARSGYNGTPLTIETPDGWSDWMAASQDISSQLDAIGINVSSVSVAYNTRESDEANGTYDMVLENRAGISSDPWSYFDVVYQLPIGAEEASGLNVERFTDPAAWALVEKAATTSLADTAKLHTIYSDLEKDFLQDLPEVPLYDNSAWFQANNTTWTNYPSSLNSTDQYTPVMWSGWLGAMTTVYALAALQPSQ
jgi:peptide/nickel transport system substrate-binding protein